MLILEGDKRMASVNRMIPILVYRDVEKAHDFLVNVFGFEPVALERDDAGHVRHVGHGVRCGRSLRPAPDRRRPHHLRSRRSVLRLAGV